MDNHEDFLDALTAYARNPGPDIPSVLDRYLCGVAKNGETLFQWPLLKPLIVGKIEQVIQELNQGLESENIPTRPNVENVRFEVMHARIMDAVHKFTGAPFTIQRLCELLMDPKRHYKRSDKFLRGLEKNVLVVSTVDPFGRKVVSESSNKHLVNGMDGSNTPLLPRDPHSSTPLPPVPDWVTSSRVHMDETEGVIQESGISNGVAGGLVNSVYTDQGEQPMAVQTEEVVEETVVTMETNEMASVTEEGGEAMADEEEEEEVIGGEEANASSSSNSSSSSEELTSSDSSESSARTSSSVTTTMSRSSSTKENQEDNQRAWACLASALGQDTDSISVHADPSSSMEAQSKSAWLQTSQESTELAPQNSPTSDGEITTEGEMSSTISWHPLTAPTTQQSDSTCSVASETSQSPTQSSVQDANDSLGFETVTTSALTKEDSDSAPQTEDLPPVSDAGLAEQWSSVASSSSSTTTTACLDSSNTILSPSAPPAGFPECDSVAGLERLVSSVDAASPIAVLSASTSSSTSSTLNPLPYPEDVEEAAEEEPAAKRARLSKTEQREKDEEESPVPQEDVSSTSLTSEDGMEDRKESSSDVTSVSQSGTAEAEEEPSDTSADSRTNLSKITSGTSTHELGGGDGEKEKTAAVGSSPCELSSSSSSSSLDSQGFDVCGDGPPSKQEEEKDSNQPPESTNNREKDAGEPKEEQGAH